MRNGITLLKFLIGISLFAVPRLAADRNATQLVDAMATVHQTGGDERRELLMQELADATSSESAADLCRVIVSGATGLTFEQLPDDLQYAIKKAVRLNADPEPAARALRAAYTDARPLEVIENLESVQHPRTWVMLAQEMAADGDLPRAEHLLELVYGSEDPRALEALLLLAETNLLSIEDVRRRARTFVAVLGDRLDVDHYTKYLSDPQTTRAVVSVVVFALAGSGDDRARVALEKALRHITDPSLREAVKAGTEVNHY